ncbi:hypothetical protein Tco_1160212, partial [Tanacetum coccineum]
AGAGAGAGAGAVVEAGVGAEAYIINRKAEAYIFIKLFGK